MGEGVPFLLDDSLMDGPVGIRREVVTPRLLVAVSDGYAAAHSAVQACCERWGGGADLLVPMDSDGRAPSSWLSFIGDSDAEGWLAFGGNAENMPERPMRTDPTPEPLASVVAGLRPKYPEMASVQVTELEEEDPWWIAYLGVLGTLPEVVELAPAPNWIREGLRYDEIVTVERQAAVGSGPDLLDRVRDHLIPIALAQIELSRPRQFTSMSGEPIFPSDLDPTSLYGPNIVVVYEPDSVADLCLLWNLRASLGHGGGAPLAVPATADVPKVLANWVERRALHLDRLAGRSQAALLSESVGRPELEELARELDDRWEVGSSRELLTIGPQPGRQSSGVVDFEAGEGHLTAWSDEDLSALAGIASHDDSLSTVVRVRPLNRRLPPSQSLSVRGHAAGHYRLGSFQTAPQSMSDLVRVQWPAGWTVLEALARDHGLLVRRSEPGRAAEALVARMGGVSNASLLSSREVIALLYRLGEQSGSTFFKKKLREIGSAAVTEDQVYREVAASPDDPDLRSMTDDEMKDIGARSERHQWIEWAEDHGILVRGATTECPSCRHKQWNTIDGLAPPIACRGCGEGHPRPFGADQLKFRYRASETLLRVLEADSIGHVLALDWMRGLFRADHDGVERLYGGHPGVEFVDPTDGHVIGEADIVLVFTDGSLVFGEYKRSGKGLHEGDLVKLDLIAERMAADWTFVATHDSIEDCSEIWESCRACLPDRPRFVLTGERLFSEPIWALGANPFDIPEPREDGAGGWQTPAPGSQVEWMRRFERPDPDLHLAWEHEDHKPSD